MWSLVGTDVGMLSEQAVRNELEAVQREERKYSGRRETHGVTRPGEWERGVMRPECGARENRKHSQGPDMTQE